jgi:hypothetical protein
MSGAEEQFFGIVVHFDGTVVKLTQGFAMLLQFGGAGA